MNTTIQKLITSVSFFVFSLIIFAQTKEEYSTDFNLAVEPSLLRPGFISSKINCPTQYNLKSKTDIQKVLFPDYNAPIEYFVAPSFDGSYGFRIQDLGNDSCELEVKWISNWKEVRLKLGEEFPAIGIPVELSFKLPKQANEVIGKYNYSQFEKRNLNAIQHYKVEAKRVMISKAFFDQLYSSFVYQIKNHKFKGYPAMVLDGESVNFRYVSDDLLWNFNIHSPAPSEKFGKLKNICDQIVRDVKENRVLISDDYIKKLTSLRK